MPAFFPSIEWTDPKSQFLPNPLKQIRPTFESIRIMLITWVFFCSVLHSTNFLFLCFCVSATRCSELRTCGECQANAACGWCDDGSNTGLGTCMQGGADGPLDSDQCQPTIHTLTPDAEPQNRWHFVSCPGTYVELIVVLVCTRIVQLRRRWTSSNWGLFKWI